MTVVDRDGGRRWLPVEKGVHSAVAGFDIGTYGIEDHEPHRTVWRPLPVFDLNRQRGVTPIRESVDQGRIDERAFLSVSVGNHAV